MRKLVPVLLLLLGCAFAPSAARADWRFGYEWNENWPWSPREDGAQVSALLDKLAAASPGAAVNINGMRGWAALQARAGGPINFAPTDQSVRVFQQHGLELTWYLNCNARWAWVDPNARAAIGASMAPAPAYEDDWQALVRAVVERYDGDGVADLPGLTKPIRFYVLTGEVHFDRSGLGDRETPPFWADTIPHLLRLHRLTYQAIRQADPSGKTQLVGSGALLWDLYGDFPDYPQFDPPQRRSTIRQRLAGANFKGSDYRQAATVHNAPDYGTSNFKTLAPRLYAMAGVGPKDVDALQSYENFTGGVMMSIVEHGFCEPDEVNEFFTLDNFRADGGVLPLNTSGGNLAECYMHGLELITEAVRLIRGTSPSKVERQVNVSMVTSGPMVQPVSSLILGREAN